MRRPEDRWTPTRAQGEWLIDALTARLPPAKIAQRLNIDEATLRSYLERLRAADDAPRS
jgi:DNA-binding GntR family transcriptional regulator